MTMVQEGINVNGAGLGLRFFALFVLFGVPRI